MYMFALTSGDQMTRLLLVEAQDKSNLTRILMETQWVSKNCYCLAVMPGGKDSISLSSLVQNVPYVEFLNDFVDPRLIAAVQPEIPVQPEILIREVGDSGQPEKLTSALCGLGFKKSEVRDFVKGLGDRARQDPLQTLIREGLATLAA